MARRHRWPPREPPTGQIWDNLSTTRNAGDSGRGHRWTGLELPRAPRDLESLWARRRRPCPLLVGAASRVPIAPARLPSACPSVPGHAFSSVPSRGLFRNIHLLSPVPWEHMLVILFSADPRLRTPFTQQLHDVPCLCAHYIKHYGKIKLIF